MSDLRTAALQALEFCEFLWREVAMNDYAEEQRERVEAALRAALAHQEPDLRNANPIGLTPPQKALQLAQFRADALAQQEAIERHRAIDAALKERNHE
jgi:hypothetical protein